MRKTLQPKQIENLAEKVIHPQPEGSDSDSSRISRLLDFFEGQLTKFLSRQSSTMIACHTADSAKCVSALPFQKRRECQPLCLISEGHFFTQIQ